MSEQTPTPTAAEAAAAEAVAAAEADAAGLELNQRLWLKAIIPVLQLRTGESAEAPQPTGRVQYALDRLYIAACERVCRILRSDLPTDRD